jgi:hypothetical protein
MLAHDARKAVSAAHRSRRRMYRILLRPTALQAGRTANRPAARPYHLDGSRGSHPNLQTLASQRSRATEVSHTSSASRAPSDCALLYARALAFDRDTRVVPSRFAADPFATMDHSLDLRIEEGVREVSVGAAHALQARGQFRWNRERERLKVGLQL